MWHFHMKNSFVISSQLLSVTFSFSLFFPSFRSLSIRFSRAVYGHFFLDKCYLHTAPLLTLFLYWGWTGSVVKTTPLNNGFNDRVSKVENGTDIYLSKYSEGAGHKLDIARGRATSWTLITGAAHSLLQTRAENLGETGLNYHGNIVVLCLFFT